MSASQTALSLLAEFDDLMRCTHILMESSQEPEFIRFVVNMEQCRLKWLAALEDCRRLQGELEKANKDISELEGKLFHARRIFDNEKKRRVDAESQVIALERKLSLVRELVFVDGGARINDETREKLNFLNTMTNSTIGHEDIVGHGSRLTTISEGMNSTGSLLADLSVSQSEDDLDVRDVCGGKEWRKHRSSLICEGEASSAKRRRSEKKERTLDLDATDGVVATATFTMMKDGPVEVSTKVQPVAMSRSPCNPTMPSAPPIEAEDSVWGTNRVNLITPQSTPSTGRHAQVSPNIAGLYPFGMNNKVNSRAHNFCNKVVIYPEDCGPCGKRIKFGKYQLKCRDCRATCHPDCREQVPLPCVPVNNTPTRKGGVVSTIADYAPPTCPMVPALIVHCVKEVESRGLTEVGIYRVPGAEKDVKMLKEKFLRGKGVPNLSKVDVHVICGTLKDFLRSLSQPLVPQSQWQDFTKAAEDQDQDVGQALMIQAISELPQPNRDTLAYLIMHLQRVGECPECKMPASNLAKVFGPTIVGYSSMNPEPAAMLTETRKQVAVVEHLMSISSDYWANFVNVDVGLISKTPSEAYLITPSTENLIPNSGSKHFFTPMSRAHSRKGSRFFPNPRPGPNC